MSAVETKSLRIRVADPAIIAGISTATGVHDNMGRSGFWGYHVIEQEGDPFFDISTFALDFLGKHAAALSELGVESDDVSVWIEVSYSQQCNMEFSSEFLARISSSKASLCISCYETH